MSSSKASSHSIPVASENQLGTTKPPLDQELLPGPNQSHDDHPGHDYHSHDHHSHDHQSHDHHSHSHAHHHGHADAHQHSEESQRRIINRLSRVEGHIRGIKAMVQRNEDCPDVLIQIAAVRGALDRIARMILDEHLAQCIVRAASEGDVATELEELKTALDRFLPRDKPSGKKQD